MIPSHLTEGMSTIEILVVLCAANASPDELARLRDFFNRYNPTPGPSPAKT